MTRTDHQPWKQDTRSADGGSTARAADTSGGTPRPGSAARAVLGSQELLSVEQLSQWLQVPKQTVYRWRSFGGGPRGFRIGRHVRYAVSDVRDWLDTQRDR